jgi:hypothetical protein
MQLLELTPDEIAFLKAPYPLSDDLQMRLTRKLAMTLSARLRLPLEAMPQPAPALVDTPASPTWQPDAALANLWLTRRLGGRDAGGSGPFVPASCVRTLDAVLAECWLDAPAQVAPPRALAWRITTGLTQATLTVALPHSTTDMTRWAREVIRHG